MEKLSFTTTAMTKSSQDDGVNIAGLLFVLVFIGLLVLIVFICAIKIHVC